MPRVTSDEWMDDPDVDRDELARSLGFIRWVNRRIGGSNALLRCLRAWAGPRAHLWPAERPITLLDAATGSADLPIAARKWSLRSGYDLRIIGIDFHQTTLELAREHLSTQPAAIRRGVDLLHLDAMRVADHFGADSFDYVHAGLFLHHLKNDVQAMTLLAQMNRVARAGVIVNDLRRSKLGMLGAKLITFRAPAIVKHDACASVRAAFAPGEALELARRAGLYQPRVRASLLTQRWVLTSAKPQPTLGSNA